MCCLRMTGYGVWECHIHCGRQQCDTHNRTHINRVEPLVVERALAAWFVALRSGESKPDPVCRSGQFHPLHLLVEANEPPVTAARVPGVLRLEDQTDSRTVPRLRRFPW